MNNMNIIPPDNAPSNELRELEQAANSSSVLEAAKCYARLGFVVIPLTGKKPVAPMWQLASVPSEAALEARFLPGKPYNVGIVCGKNSGNLVVIDLDSQEAYEAFARRFPDLAKTYTVATGGGEGRHVYLRATNLPANVDAKGIPLKNVELRATGRQVVAPPSIHPDTGQPYTVEHALPIKVVDNVAEVVAWIESLKPLSKGYNAAPINPRVKEALRAYFETHGYKSNGAEWLNGPCVYPDHHANGDAHHSFSYNVETGVGYCHAEARPILTKDLCAAVGIDYGALGGLKATNGAKPSGPRGGVRPTHDEIGDELLNRWNGDRAFFRDDWHTYTDGCWKIEPNVSKAVWDAMKAHKPKGIKPTKSAVNSVEDYLKSQLRVPDDLIDQGDDYVNLTNGLYNLRTDQLEPHRRDLYLTSQLPFAHDPQAQCPNWDQVLATMLVTPEGTPDDDLRRLLQEAFGYSLTTSTRFQVSFWLFGPPASGKSRVIETVAQLMGEAHTAVDLSALQTNHYQLANVPGKRVVLCTEAPTNSVLVDHLFKQLVAGDRMVVRQIRREPFTFKPQCKVWWSMNVLPRNLDRSGAVDRRVLILPFNRRLEEHEQDRTLQEKLNAELPGIFIWALEGLRRLEQNGKFTLPQQVVQAKAEYQSENDTEKAFIEEGCIRADTAEIRANVLYTAYQNWCRQNGHTPKNQMNVARDWQRLGFTKKRDSKSAIYVGLQLKDEPENDSSNW